MVDKRSAKLDEIFQVLSDPTRRAIVSMLSERPHNVGELLKPFPVSLNAISKHIKALERAGIVDREIIGRVHLCHLNPKPLNEAYAWLSTYELFWTDRLDTLEKLLAKKVHHAKRP